MTRLRTELQRLFGLIFDAADAAADPAPVAADTPLPATGLVDAQGRTRALVMSLSAPAEWTPLAAVWAGVQTDLDLPAPAIAVSGHDGLQLWFALAEPVGVSQAQAFLEGLRARYLADVAHRRVELLPVGDPSVSGGVRHAMPVPRAQAGGGNWSAFVARDLAPVFADSPWLDLPPNDEGQAGLLSGLTPIGPAAFTAALRTLRGGAAGPLPPAPPPGAGLPASPVAAELSPIQTAAGLAAARAARAGSGAGGGGASTAPEATVHRMGAGFADPRHFLFTVMNDDTVPLALRIEAAKALL
jgi:hypothetical protein